MKKTILALAATGAMLVAAPAAYAECGSFKMAEFDWASGELMANIDKFILEEGYGCEIELVQGGTTQIFASMSEKGSPEIAGELWVNAVRETLDKAVAEGTMKVAVEGPITDLGEGWWVTQEFAEKHPELNTVEKVLERPDLFPDSEDPSKGSFMGCPAGWGCQLINANLYRAYGMEEKGWRLVDPGSAAGLDGSIAKASERSEPWFGYYWSPTAIVGKYGLVKLPFEAEYAGKDNWDGCIALPEQDCENPQKTSWVKSEVFTVVTDDFMEKGGVALDFLSKRIVPGPVMGEMLVYMGEEQATGEDAAIEFLSTKGDVWTKWVSPEVAAKVKAAL